MDYKITVNLQLATEIFESTGFDYDIKETENTDGTATLIFDSLLDFQKFKKMIAPEKFVVGQKYWHNFVGDSSARVIYTIVRRTEKSVWIQNEHSGKIMRKLVQKWGPNEPERASLGSYSMAPSLYADSCWSHPQEEKAPVETQPVPAVESPNNILQFVCPF